MPESKDQVWNRAGPVNVYALPTVESAMRRQQVPADSSGRRERMEVAHGVADEPVARSSS